jgi:hypothetical protein
LVSVTIFGLGLAAEGRNRKSQQDVWIGAAILAAAVLIAAQLGPDPSRWKVPTLLVGFVPCGLLIGLLYLVDAAGLPPALAARTGVGLHVRSIRFYEELRVEWKKFDSAIGRARSRPSAMVPSLDAAATIVKRIRKLPAPDATWAKFRDDLVRCDERWIEVVRAGSEVAWARQQEAYSRLVLEAQRLVATDLATVGSRPAQFRSLRGRVVGALVVATGVVVALSAVGIGSPSSLDGLLWLKWSGLSICLAALFGVAWAGIGSVRASRQH